MDIEGGEPAALRGLDFNAVMIHVLTIEFRSPSSLAEVSGLVAPYFEVVGAIDGGDVLAINRASPFIKAAPAAARLLAEQAKVRADEALSATRQENAEGRSARWRGSGASCQPDRPQFLQRLCVICCRESRDVSKPQLFCGNLDKLGLIAGFPLSASPARHRQKFQSDHVGLPRDLSSYHRSARKNARDRQENTHVPHRPFCRSPFRRRPRPRPAQPAGTASRSTACRCITRSPAPAIR